jgi:hypothetical protein
MSLSCFGLCFTAHTLSWDDAWCEGCWVIKD